MTTYLVAIAAAALFAVIEEFARLQYLPWRGDSWRWWLGRIALEAVVAVVFVFASASFGVRIEQYELADVWWGGAVLAFVGAVAARSSFGGGNTEPAGATVDVVGPEVRGILPPGVYGIATFFAPARLALERRLDESGSATLSRQLVDEIPLALEKAGLGLDWVAERLRAWISARKTMPSADRAAELARIDKTLRDEGVGDDEKVQLLLGRAAELHAHQLLKDIHKQAKKQGSPEQNVIPRRWRNPR